MQNTTRSKQSPEESKRGAVHSKKNSKVARETLLKEKERMPEKQCHLEDASLTPDCEAISRRCKNIKEVQRSYDKDWIDFHFTGTLGKLVEKAQNYVRGYGKFCNALIEYQMKDVKA